MNLLPYIIIALLCVLVAFLFHISRTQKAALRRMSEVLARLNQGEYSLRAEALDAGPAGLLARALNSLAGDLEQRAAKARQDRDHLVALLAMLDHTNEIALATDSTDCVRLFNSAAARILDRPVDQLMGKHVDNILHQPELLALYRQAFTANRPVAAQIALSTNERTLHCQVTAAPIYSGTQYRGTLLLMRDITEIARTLQMKTDFVSNASHELRTPMASIRAAVETIKDAGPEDGETVRRCVEIINNHVLRLQLMVQDLLDLSRTEDPRATVRHDRLDLQQICEMVIGMYSSQAADKHIQLLAEISPDARALRGDERLLMLCLKNLVDNAIKFTATGSVTIRSYRTSAESKVLSSEPINVAASQHSALSTQDSLVVEVADTGCGIPNEDQERVFERFYTVNRSRGGADRGTGLGLAIVKHAVAAMGGQVELRSEVNRGTTIRCIFPLRAPTNPEPAAV